jgi:outer membrane receptor protein involved in Fe transport
MSSRAAPSTGLGFSDGYYYNGGAIFYDNDGNASSSWTPVDLNGDGYFNNYLEIKIPEAMVKNPVETSGTMYTVFLQDSWRVHPNLTLKPGVRLDKTLMYNALDAEIADMEARPGWARPGTWPATAGTSSAGRPAASWTRRLSTSRAWPRVW